jgi:hypothetical protein
VGREDDPGAFPPDYEAQVWAFLQHVLEEPCSVRGLRITRPIQSLRTWQSCVSLDAKNRFGAYGGPKDYTFHFSDGLIVGTQRGCDGLRF